jgi:hypothetical protein
MSALMTHRDDCRLCLSSNLEQVVKLKPVPLAEKYSIPGQVLAREEFYPIDLSMCLDCGHVQLLDVIDAHRLWDDYTYHSGQTAGIVAHFQDVADRLIVRHNPPPGSLIIDVGSNDGSLLRPFKERGYRVLGIDPAREIASQATKAGIETIPELLTADLARRIRQTYGPAAIVTAFNVFAHADDMNAMAASIRRLLAADGVFQFEAQYLVDIVDKLLLGTIFHEHMSHHSLKPLKKFLERHGLEIVDVERVSIQMGSIIGTARPAGGKLPVQPAVGELLALEESRGFDRPATIRQFEVQLNELRRQIAALIALWKKSGARVAGYGAARSGPTFIEQFGLPEAIEYILDDHPQKVNRLSPGHHIPVLPTDQLLKRMPDYVVILASIHAKKIIASHREYLERGGHFVTWSDTVAVVGKDNAAAFHSPVRACA